MRTIASLAVLLGIALLGVGVASSSLDRAFDGKPAAGGVPALSTGAETEAPPVPASPAVGSRAGLLLLGAGLCAVSFRRA